MRKLNVGAEYRHFKGGRYKVLGVAEHSETGERLVIYQALYGSGGIYVRPYDMFMSPVDTIRFPNSSQKYRFEEIVPEDIHKA